MPRRKKVDELPEEIRSELNRLLIERAFGDFRGLEGWLEERGYSIGKSSIHRYSRDFQAQMEDLRVATEQARAIAEVCGDDENSLGDALSRLAQQKLMDALRDIDPAGVEELSLDRLVNAIANLNKSANATKKHSSDVRKKIKQVSEEVAETARSSGLSETAAEEIRRKILGVAE
jgi:hypothetical protein